MGVDFTVFKGSKSGEIVEGNGHRDPGPTEVLVAISHCGVCGTDEHFRHVEQGLGHEGIGTIIELGSAVNDVSDFKVGDRVGMSWFWKFCGVCKPCITGWQNCCENAKLFGNANRDQGCFGTAVAWDVSTLYRVPDAIASEDAGPLMCGGATVFEPLRRSGVRAGDRVGIIGIGGLGHLAIQFSAKLGLETVVFSSSESKREEAKKFGASSFHVVSELEHPESIEKIDLLLCTSSVSPDLAKYFPVLAKRAQIYPLTVSHEPLPVPVMGLIEAGAKLVGSNVASPSTVRDMLDFAARHNIKPQIETFPLTRDGVHAAMQKLREGKIRYRGVLVAK
ncbi:NADP-dependent alcohol dehydrogenase [Mariannaea sp. PMI_226]|nr:NADP-dependent alcohol dehydrogenase [Mariannaea sp. PMI_226]